MQEKPVPPRLGPAGLQRLVMWAPIVVMSFTCLSRTWGQEVLELESGGKDGACGSMKAWLGFFSMSRAAPWCLGCDPPCPVLDGRPGRARDRSAGSAGPMELGAPPAPRFSPDLREMAHPPEPPGPSGRRSPERGRGGRSETACGPGSRGTSACGNKSQESGSSRVAGYKEPSSANGVGWSWRPRTAEWLVPRLPLEKWLAGGQRLEEGASLGLFCPSTMEGDTFAVLPSALLLVPILILLFMGTV